MTPDDLSSFAKQYLEPLVPWLVRHDLAWEPAPAQAVSPVEFVLAPVGPVKCALGMAVWPSGWRKKDDVRFGLDFTPLYLPRVSECAVPLRQGRAWTPRWKLVPGREGQDAKAIASALEKQWPRGLSRMGSVEAIARSLEYDASESWEMLEELGYSRFIIGDSEGGLRSLRETAAFRMPDEDRERIVRMEKLIQADPSAASRQLVAWRHERLAELGLADLAASWDL